MDKNKVEAYLDNPVKCPSCGSDNWVNKGTNYEFNIIVCFVECEDCKFQANEIYTLTNIKPTEKEYSNG